MMYERSIRLFSSYEIWEQPYVFFNYVYMYKQCKNLISIIYCLLPNQAATSNLMFSFKKRLSDSHMQKITLAHKCHDHFFSNIWKKKRLNTLFIIFVVHQIDIQKINSNGSEFTWLYTSVKYRIMQCLTYKRRLHVSSVHKDGQWCCIVALVYK